MQSYVKFTAKEVNIILKVLHTNASPLVRRLGDRLHDSLPNGTATCPMELIGEDDEDEPD